MKSCKDAIVCFLPLNKEKKGKNSAPSQSILSSVFDVRKDLFCHSLPADMAIERVSAELQNCRRKLSSSVF